MATDAVAFTLAQLVVFLLAIVVHNRRFAPRRLTSAELVAQAGVVSALVARYLRGRRATREDVKDLAQDVLLAAWEASEEDRYRPDPDVQPAEALRVWIRALAYHRVRHHLESARVRREEIVATPPSAEHEAPTPDQAIEREERRLAFLEALHQLPVHEGDVIIAHDIFEMSIEDAAEQQDAPVSTAYRWRSRGIEALIRALRPRRG
ncbi:sigma-70 family RNA polymerase sigma factor [Sorangium sp. So ce281]|uniref:RNA polymerase sigma factor n=1 Tax=unclassified Sorangium TaxID=2621164 RepID=UPI003F5F4D93